MRRTPKQKIIVIVGPNASGKSLLGVALARRFNGEVISADSRQVYRGLDIATGKINRHEMRGIPHHLLDIANPKRQFSVAEFKMLAEQAAGEIRRRGKTPFIVGGTGFWIDTLVFGNTFPSVPPNSKLRKRLGGKPVHELFSMLKKLDPTRAKTIEQKNPRRLIRAIEIARSLGRVPKQKKSYPFDALWLGVAIAPAALHRRIRMRVAKRLRAGMIQEAERLRAEGLSEKRLYEFGLEYRMLADYLQKKIPRYELAQQIERVDRDYARRQMVWFKKNPAIIWITSQRQAEKLIKNFLERHEH